jgi:uncharacterized membrane protein
MNKHEFLHQLSRRLSGLPKNEQEEILADYQEHFLIGMAKGRSEEEISRALGDPRSLGKEYAALSLVRRAEKTPSARGLSHAIIATVGLGLFNLLVVLMPFLLLFVLFVFVLVCGFSLACAGPALIGYSVLELLGVVRIGMPVHPLAGVFFGIGLTSFGLLVIAVQFWLTRVLYRLGIRYLKWNIAVITGREAI